MSNSNIFSVTYRRLNLEGTHWLPGGGRARMDDPIVLPRPPSEVTIGEFKQIVMEKYSAQHAKFITPLEEGDESRTLKDWVENPTKFQFENNVVSENQLFRDHRGVYGKIAIDLYIAV